MFNRLVAELATIMARAELVIVRLRLLLPRSRRLDCGRWVRLSRLKHAAIGIDRVATVQVARRGSRVRDVLSSACSEPSVPSLEPSGMATQGARACRYPLHPPVWPGSPACRGTKLTF